MDRGVSRGLYGEARRLAADVEGGRVLDRFESEMRRLGATHLCVTGLPMPRRSMAKLMVRMDWPDGRGNGHLLDVSPADPLLVRARVNCRPFFLRDGAAHGCREPRGDGEHLPATASELVAAAGPEATVLVVPVHDLRPWQGAVILAGRALPTEPAWFDELAHFCTAALRTLVELGRIDVARPGDLSDRERDVLRLAATGMTASEIAERLTISQRTVHAHFQNAADKMNAANKTQTVIEALRHGQIAL